MNGKSDETLSRKSEERTSSRVEPIFGLFRVSRQPEPMRPGEAARKLQKPRASMQAGVTETTTMTIRVRPLPELQISNRNRR